MLCGMFIICAGHKWRNTSLDQTWNQSQHKFVKKRVLVGFEYLRDKPELRIDLREELK